MPGKRHPDFKTTEPLYAVWSNMHARCENPNHVSYRHYGARGITVCNEWEDYLTFRKWATKSGYRKEYSIDRINNNGNYEPSNCRWASRKDQSRNRRNNRIVTYQGVSKSLAEWADDPRCVVSYKKLWERLEDGWDFEDALMRPERRKGGYRLITAWEEEKSITEWVADPRCPGVKLSTLWKRINEGWTPERAISTPTRGSGVI